LLFLHAIVLGELLPVHIFLVMLVARKREVFPAGAGEGRRPFLLVRLPPGNEEHIGHPSPPSAYAGIRDELPASPKSLRRRIRPNSTARLADCGRSRQSGAPATSIPEQMTMICDSGIGPSPKSRRLVQSGGCAGSPAPAAMSNSGRN